MSQVTVKDIVPEGNVEGVHPETRAERLLRLTAERIRLITASIIVLAGFILLVVILMTGSPEYVKYHDGAWSLILTMIGAAMGYIFATRN